MTETPSVISQILEVLSSIATWIVDSVNQMVSVFYTPTDGITILGVLAIIGFGLAAVYGLLKFITGFARG